MRLESWTAEFVPLDLGGGYRWTFEARAKFFSYRESGVTLTARGARRQIRKHLRLARRSAKDVVA